MQNDRRKLKKLGAEMLTIGYSIYEVLYCFYRVVATLPVLASFSGFVPLPVVMYF